MAGPPPQRTRFGCGVEGAFDRLYRKIVLYNTLILDENTLD